MDRVVLLNMYKNVSIKKGKRLLYLRSYLIQHNRSTNGANKKL